MYNTQCTERQLPPNILSNITENSSNTIYYYYRTTESAGSLDQQPLLLLLSALTENTNLLCSAIKIRCEFAYLHITTAALCQPWRLVKITTSSQPTTKLYSPWYNTCLLFRRRRRRIRSNRSVRWSRAADLSVSSRCGTRLTREEDWELKIYYNNCGGQKEFHRLNIGQYIMTIYAQGGYDVGAVVVVVGDDDDDNDDGQTQTEHQDLIWCTQTNTHPSSHSAILQLSVFNWLHRTNWANLDRPLIGTYSLVHRETPR